MGQNCHRYELLTSMKKLERMVCFDLFCLFVLVFFVVLFCFCFFVFNDISVISWWLVLLVEETGVPGENHRPAARH